MRRILTMLIVASAAVIIPAALPAAETAGGPALDPQTAEKVINLIIALTAGQPWGIWVYIGFATLGFIAMIARLIVQATDSTRDDQVFIKYFGWIPTLTSVKNANRLVGKNSGKIKSVIKDLFGKALLPLVIVTFSLAAVTACDAETGKPQWDKVENAVAVASTVANEVEIQLPMLEQRAQAFCGAAAENAPKWCGDIDIHIADVRDSLAITRRSVADARALLESRNGEPEEIARNLTQAALNLGGSLFNVQAIMLRHKE